MPLLIVEALLAPLITAQTISQVSAGVILTPGQIVGPVFGFVILALAAIAVLWSILRRIPLRQGTEFQDSRPYLRRR